MKHKSIFTVGLFLTLVTVVAFFAQGCKDDEPNAAESSEDTEKIYPEGDAAKPFEVDGGTGEFIQYNEDADSWYINFDNPDAVLRQSFGDEDAVEVLVTNMTDEYKTFTGKLRISGTVRLEYVLVPKYNAAGVSVHHYTLEIKELEQIESNSLSKSLTLTTDSSECGTTEVGEPDWLFERASNGPLAFKTYKFRVSFHIVRNSDGSGTVPSTIQTVIDKLNNSYSGTNISFTATGVDYINDDGLNQISASRASFKKLFARKHNAKAINVYILTDGSHLGGIVGAADSIPSNSLLVRASHCAKGTIAHEVGHCIGLYHTHHGTYFWESGTPELVNGSNSAVAGDFIVDTPADPNEWDKENGVYNGGDLTDANGDKYNPSPTNFMSYNKDACRTEFTRGQIESVYKCISNTRSLQSACTISSASISGPDLLNSTATYSVDIPDGYDISWNVTVDTYTSKTAHSISHQTAKGSSITLTSKSPAQTFNIVATIKNSLGIEFQLSKFVRHCAISDETGTLTWGSEISGTSGYGKTGTLKIGGVSSSNVIKVYQGGDLYFYYTDAAGANSRTSNDFNFTLTNSTSNFSKHSGAKHAFKCSETANVGSYTDNLVVSCGSQMNVTPVTIQILSKSATADLEEVEEEGDVDDGAKI